MSFPIVALLSFSLWLRWLRWLNQLTARISVEMLL